MDHDDWIDVKDVFIQKSKKLPIPEQQVLFFSCIEPLDLNKGLTEQEWFDRFQKKKNSYSVK